MSYLAIDRIKKFYANFGTNSKNQSGYFFRYSE